MSHPETTISVLGPPSAPLGRLMERHKSDSVKLDFRRKRWRSRAEPRLASSCGKCTSVTHP